LGRERKAIPGRGGFRKRGTVWIKLQREKRSRAGRSHISKNNTYNIALEKTVAHSRGKKKNRRQMKRKQSVRNSLERRWGITKRRRGTDPQRTKKKTNKKKKSFECVGKLGMVVTYKRGGLNPISHKNTSLHSNRVLQNTKNKTRPCPGRRI